jgi:hypothetical protein
MTEQQRPICSGVFARLILHAVLFAADMAFHRSRPAEIKRGVKQRPGDAVGVTKSWLPALIYRNVFPL